MSLNVAVIVGSVRPNRVGRDVADWYLEQVNNVEGANFDLIDLAEVNLPLLDEPVPPAAGQYSKDHTKAWAEKISQYDAYVWVTSEYNHAAPASLTNAISFLFAEWGRKAVAMVSYGSMGGVRAVEHLRAIAGELQMADIRLQVAVRSPWDMKDENGAIKQDLVFGNPVEQAEQLIWWGEALKAARSKDS